MGNEMMTVRDIPLKLRHEFKMAAMANGKTVKGTIKELMEAYVKASKKKGEKR